tara:strand:- start:3964 stop:6735 length:2772 start_codon:yes stop_codon:yes gene_type:complete
MSLIQFLEKNEINYCPINLHYCEDKKKWIESKDVNTLTSGTKFIDDNTDTPLFWKCKKEEIRKRKVLLETDPTFYKHLIIDCRKYWQTDIDIENETEKDNLNEKSEEIYNTMKDKMITYGSNNKEYGFHTFIMNTKIFPDAKMKILSETTKNENLSSYKKNECKHIYRAYDWIELIKDKIWATIDKELMNVPTNKTIQKEQQKSGSEILTEIIKPNYWNKKLISDKEKEEKKKQSLKKRMQPIQSKEDINKKKEEIGLVEEKPLDYETEMYKELILNIDKQYWNTNNDCFKIIGCIAKMKNETLKNTFKDIIRTSEKTRNNFEEWYDKQEKSSKRYGFKHNQLITFSKNSNVNKHYEIISKYDCMKNVNECEYGLTAEELAQKFLENNMDNVIVQNPQTKKDSPEVYFYDLHNQIWINQSRCGEKNTTIKYYVGIDISSYLQNLMNQELKKEEPNGLLVEGIAKALKQVKNNTLKNNIVESVIQYIYIYKRENITFDNIPLKLVFRNNVVFDFETMTTNYKIEKTDYILTKLTNDWLEEDELDEEEEEEFKKFYDELMLLPEWENEEEEKLFRARQDDLTYFLCMCLIGRKQALLFILNASGRNGKSLLMKILEKLLTGCLMCNSMNSSILTKDIDSERGIPELAILDFIRCCIFNECDENKSLCITTIKKMLGEDVLQVRGLYENGLNKNIAFLTMAICLNERPHFDGTSNEGLSSKIIDLYFPNTFVDDYDCRCDKYKKDRSGYYYKKDTTKMNSSFADDMAFYLLKYCINFMKSYKEKTGNNIWDASWQFSKLTKDRTLDYLSSLNNIGEWVNENVIKTEDTRECLNIYEDLWEKFIKTQEYQDTDAKKRPKKERFRSDIKNSDYFSEYFNDKNTTRNGKRLFKSGWLEGFVLSDNQQNIPPPTTLQEENTIDISDFEDE